MQKVSIYSASKAWRKGKPIASSTVSESLVSGVILGYCNQLNNGFMQRGYFGLIRTVADDTYRGKRVIKLAYSQACTVFENKNFLVEVVPI